MGTFHVAIEIGAQTAARYVAIDALVDTGASYTWVARDLLDELGVVPEEEWLFELADGRQVRYPVGWMSIRIGGREHPTRVVFGEPGSEPILGAFTLEGFCLAADPVNRRLIQARALLKAAS